MIEEKKERELAQARRDLAQKNEQAEKYRRTIELLSTIDFRAQHLRIQATRHEGTAMWLMQENSFIDWLNGPGSDAFCCFGIPGSGKTVLASSIIDHMWPLYTDDNCALIFHYCEYTSEATLDTNLILGNLTRQLIEKVGLPDPMSERIRDSYKDGLTRPPWTEVLKLLQENICSLAKLMIVIDGVDELAKETQESIVSVMNTFMSQSNTCIKIIICSRQEEPLIRNSFSPNPSLDITSTHLRTDISRFIEENIEANIRSGDLTLKDPTLRDIIIQKLLEGAKEM